MMLAPLRVKLAQSYADRLRGVGLRVAWREFDAVCMPRCRAVHTLALARPIDVVFCFGRYDDRGGQTSS